MPYFQDSAGALYFLSDADIANGGMNLIPSDCTPITDAQAAAIQGPPLTLSQVGSKVRAERAAALHATDWLITRHHEESLFGAKTTLTKDQGQKLGAYRQALRDLPAAVGFPHVELPVAPDFIGVK